SQALESQVMHKKSRMSREAHSLSRGSGYGSVRGLGRNSPYVLDRSIQIEEGEFSKQHIVGFISLITSFFSL
ncbi:MAG: hypothetical protein ACJA2S_004605, partial [Cyclobacteriaceae bacterium]